MCEVNGVYTQGFNRRHGRVGHVLQGRYKAVVVDTASYLIELSRCVVLNPVRAGLGDNAGDWHWSSYRSMMDKDAFVVRMVTLASKQPASREVPRRGRLVPTLVAMERQARTRDVAVRVAYTSGGYTLAEIGDLFGLHYSTVSRIAAGHTDGYTKGKTPLFPTEWVQVPDIEGVGSWVSWTGILDRTRRGSITDQGESVSCSCHSMNTLARAYFDFSVGVNSTKP